MSRFFTAVIFAGLLAIAFVTIRDNMVNSRQRTGEPAGENAKPPQDCGERTWALINAKGEKEEVPQRFVASAVTEKGFTFPPEAERIIVAKIYAGPCDEDGTFAAEHALHGLRSGYMFRGYRRSTAEERQKDEARKRYGEEER